MYLGQNIKVIDQTLNMIIFIKQERRSSIDKVIGQLLNVIIVIKQERQSNIDGPSKTDLLPTDHGFITQGQSTSPISRLTTS